MSERPGAGDRILRAGLTFWHGRLHTGLQMAIAPSGRITYVGPEAGGYDEFFPDGILLPGLVSAHSHAFQIGLRGSPSRAGTFWSWRESMYGLAASLDAPGLLDLSTRAYTEMRRAGVTAVGEFHYLRHSGAERDFGLDAAVAEAGRQVGLRQVILPAYYSSGDIGAPLTGAQERFATPTLETYFQAQERLQATLDPAHQSVAAACHSVRAATPDEWSELFREARRRRMVFHMHVEEQPAEIERCRAAYGASPIELVMDRLGDLTGFIGIHATQTEAGRLAEFFDAGGRVCVCPVTEAHLGDGLSDVGAALARAPTAGGPADRLCLGTDANARLSLVEEMRWLEYGQRLRSGRRGVLSRPGAFVLPSLLEVATRGGADALGLETGRIEPGFWADFVLLDRGHAVFNGVDEDGLLEAWVFGGGNGPVVATAVGGRWQEHRQWTKS